MPLVIPSYHPRHPDPTFNTRRLLDLNLHRANPTPSIPYHRPGFKNPRRIVFRTPNPHTKPNPECRSHSPQFHPSCITPSFSRIFHYQISITHYFGPSLMLIFLTRCPPLFQTVRNRPLPPSSRDRDYASNRPAAADPATTTPPATTATTAPSSWFRHCWTGSAAEPDCCCAGGLKGQSPGCLYFLRF